MSAICYVSSHCTRERIAEQKQRRFKLHALRKALRRRDLFFFQKARRFKISLRHRVISLIYDPFSIARTVDHLTENKRIYHAAVTISRGKARRRRRVRAAGPLLLAWNHCDLSYAGAALGNSQRASRSKSEDFVSLTLRMQRIAAYLRNSTSDYKFIDAASYREKVSTVKFLPAKTKRTFPHVWRKS